jgi:DNA-binding transcriptional LysR family regulator
MAEQNFTGLDWEDIRIFVALARYGSLSAAARALSLTHATVSRRMQSLEKDLGETLVERRPDGYVLTPAGTHFLVPANEMEAAAAKLIRGGPSNGPKGLVRVNAPPSLTQSFLVTRLAKLAVDYPSLDINTTTDLRNVSLERHETDIALRFGRPQDGDVIAKFAVKLGFGFYASEKWCKRIAKGEAPEFVGFDESNAHLPEATWLLQRFPRARVAFRANIQLAQADAAKMGAGIALLPHFVGRKTTGLESCTLEHSPPSRELWIITRRQDRRDLCTRTVVDFLSDLFSKEHALFE